MSYKADIYQVIIASPGDVPRERQLTRDIVFEWNAINSREKGICLMPVGWEHNSSPEMGDRAQEFINKQLLEDSDLLIGIFWTRIGSPTGNSISGSVEEIEKHIESGKPAMIYFSNAPVIIDSVDLTQYERLKRFKEKCFGNGLVETFNSPEEFRTKLTRQLSLKIVQHDHFKLTDNLTNKNNLDVTNEDELVETLSDYERLLLMEASDDSSGSIIKASYKGGFDVQTNRKTLNEDFTPRTRALWESTFKTLIDKELIEDRGYKGEIFALTLLGYKIADGLKRLNTNTNYALI